MTDEYITIPMAKYEEFKKKMGLRFYLDDIKFMRIQGMTLQRIADFYGVTKQRISQLLKEKE